MSKKIAIVFPGQGAQSEGMGRDFFDSELEASKRLKQAFLILGKDYEEVCFNGPKETLQLTQYAQSLIFAVSAAIFEELRVLGIQPSYVAGHSLGELTAYYASGALSFEQSLALIQERGAKMAASYPHEDSAMCAVMGVEGDVLNTVLQGCSNQPVVAANFNCPGQIVISGTKSAVEEARDAIKTVGGKCIPLAVSGAFHSPLMAKASAELEEYVQTLVLETPRIPLVLNRTAREESNALELKKNISLQVKSSVYWEQSIRYMQEQGVECIIECGPGKVLSKLIQKTCPLDVFNVNSLESLSELAQQLNRG
jgi:[acyl-carrier-protein] S-malonyltransferase